MTPFALVFAFVLIPSIAGASLMSTVDFLSGGYNAAMEIHGEETTQTVFGSYLLWQYDYELLVNEGSFFTISHGFGSYESGANDGQIYPYQFIGNGVSVDLMGSQPGVTWTGNSLVLDITEIWGEPIAPPQNPGAASLAYTILYLNLGGTNPAAMAEQFIALMGNQGGISELAQYEEEDQIPIPEPGSLLLLGAGMLSLGLLIRKKIKPF